MGKISEVYYQEIEPDKCDSKEIGKSYFYYNLIGVDSMFYQGYEDHEIKLNNIRNSLIRDAIEELGYHPDISSTIFGLSSIHDKPILIIEYKGKESCNECCIS